MCGARMLRGGRGGEDAWLATLDGHTEIVLETVRARSGALALWHHRPPPVRSCTPQGRYDDVHIRTAGASRRASNPPPWYLSREGCPTARSTRPTTQTSRGV